MYLRGSGWHESRHLTRFGPELETVLRCPNLIEVTHHAQDALGLPLHLFGLAAIEPPYVQPWLDDPNAVLFKLMNDVEPHAAALDVDILFAVSQRDV